MHGRAPEHPLVRSSGPLVQMQHWAFAALRVDSELQVQATLLEHLHPVADPVVPAVLRRANPARGVPTKRALIGSQYPISVSRRVPPPASR